jgi:hypothetical protein
VQLQLGFRLIFTPLCPYSFACPWSMCGSFAALWPHTCPTSSHQPRVNPRFSLVLPHPHYTPHLLSPPFHRSTIFHHHVRLTFTCSRFSTAWCPRAPNCVGNAGGLTAPRPVHDDSHFTMSRIICRLALGPRLVLERTTLTFTSTPLFLSTSTFATTPRHAYSCAIVRLRRPPPSTCCVRPIVTPGLLKRKLPSEYFGVVP